MNDADKKALLYTHAEQAPDLPTVVFPNTRAFEQIRNTDSPFIECHDLPRRTDSRGLNGVDDKGGILQFNIYANIGSAIEPSRIADSLLLLYKRGTSFGRIRIDTAGWVDPGIKDGGRYIQPVSIPYRFID